MADERPSTALFRGIEENNERSSPVGHQANQQQPSSGQEDVPSILSTLPILPPSPMLMVDSVSEEPPARSRPRIHWTEQLVNPSPFDYQDIESPICVVENETFRILSWNRALEEITGVKSLDMLGWVEARPSLGDLNTFCVDKEDEIWWNFLWEWRMEKRPLEYLWLTLA